jgi:hypothetical protein
MSNYVQAPSCRDLKNIHDTENWFLT